MSVFEDIELNTGHTVTADIRGTSVAAGSVDTVTLGSYHTIKLFWGFWLAFSREEVLGKLPNNVNVRIYRDVVSAGCDPQKFTGSTWSADLTVESDERMLKVMVEMASLFAAEQLSALGNCITFDRRVFEDTPSYRVFIWLQGSLHETFAHLESALRRYCVKSSFQTKRHTSDRSGRFAKMPDKPKRTTMDKFNSVRKKLMAADSYETKASDVIALEAIESLHVPELKISLPEATPKSSILHTALFTDEFSGEARIGGTLDNADLLCSGGVRQSAASKLFFRAHSVGDPSKVTAELRTVVARHFAALQRVYHISVKQTLSASERRVVVAEGCPVCLRNEALNSQLAAIRKRKAFDGDDAEDVKESSGDLFLGEPWVVVKCKALGCEHVVHLECASEVPRIGLRAYHCHLFFRTLTEGVSEVSVDWKPALGDALTRRSVRIGAVLKHLISDKPTIALLPLPSTSVPTRYQSTSHLEYATRIFDDDSPVFVTLRRARVCVHVEFPSEYSSAKPRLFDANFEIPTLSVCSLASRKTPVRHKLVLESDGHSLTVVIAESLLRASAKRGGNQVPVLRLEAINYKFPRLDLTAAAITPAIDMKPATVFSAHLFEDGADDDTDAVAATTKLSDAMVTEPLSADDDDDDFDEDLVGALGVSKRPSLGLVRDKSSARKSVEESNFDFDFDVDEMHHSQSAEEPDAVVVPLPGEMTPQTSNSFSLPGIALTADISAGSGPLQFMSPLATAHAATGGKFTMPSPGLGPGFGQGFGVGLGALSPALSAFAAAELPSVPTLGLDFLGSPTSALMMKSPPPATGGAVPGHGHVGAGFPGAGQWQHQGLDHSSAMLSALQLHSAPTSAAEMSCLYGSSVAAASAMTGMSGMPDMSSTAHMFHDPYYQQQMAMYGAADGFGGAMQHPAFGGGMGMPMPMPMGGGMPQMGGGIGTGMGVPMPAMDLESMRGRIYHLCKQQNGGRFVQQRLRDPTVFALIYSELRDHIADLMMDNFGHYSVESMFAGGSDVQKHEMLGILGNHICQVACHKQGSFSIQSMMDSLMKDEHIKKLIGILKPHSRKIIMNNSGHYVILRFLQRYEYPLTEFIYGAIVNYTLEFATDHYGLRVMKAAIDVAAVGAPLSDDMQQVYVAVVKLSAVLVENQYGNYIIQHLLEVAPRSVTDAVKEKLQGKFVRYSKQKFSSNVVEKCLRQSHAEQNLGALSMADPMKDALLAEMGTETMTTKTTMTTTTTTTAESSEKLLTDWRTVIVRELISKAGDIICDKYGNYCLQTALSVATSDSALLREFIEACDPHLDSLRENVRTKWVKLLRTAEVKNRQMFSQSTDLPFTP